MRGVESSRCIIVSAHMDATWQRVGGSTKQAIITFQQACRKEQQELMGFVVGYSAELRDDPLGVALYLNTVIREAFRKSGAKFRKVTPAKILRTWDETDSIKLPSRCAKDPVDGRSLR